MVGLNQPALGFLHCVGKIAKFLTKFCEDYSRITRIIQFGDVMRNPRRHAITESLKMKSTPSHLPSDEETELSIKALIAEMRDADPTLARQLPPARRFTRLVRRLSEPLDPVIHSASTPPSGFVDVNRRAVVESALQGRTPPKLNSRPPQVAVPTPAANADAGTGPSIKLGLPITRPLAALTVASLAVLGRLAWNFLSRPDAPRFLAIGVIAGMFLTDPLFIPGLVLVLLLLMTLVALALGRQRCGRLWSLWCGRFAARHPDRAKTFEAMAKRAVEKLAKWHGYLPDPLAARLYLPAFEDKTRTARPDRDPFDRLQH